MTAQEDAVEAVVDALMRTKCFTVYETARVAISAYQKATAAGSETIMDIAAQLVDCGKDIGGSVFHKEDATPAMQRRDELMGQLAEAVTLQKATAGARDEVIEECAKVADRMRDDVEKDSDWNYDDQCEAETLDLVASAIRSLKSPPTGENK